MNEILSFAAKHMEIEDAMVNKTIQTKNTSTACSFSYVEV
jgi:hypothetical protein